MFANRTFKIAFLISLTWHLFCMSAFNVVVLPGKYKARDLTSVSFLGPLLEITALDIMMANKPTAVTTRYELAAREHHPLRGSQRLDPESDRARRYIDSSFEEHIDQAVSAMPGSRKHVPRVATKNNWKAKSAGRKSEITGAASRRTVVYRPAKPEIPSWIIARSPYVMELEFLVSASGEVDEIVPVISSGDADVDLLGIRYMKRWKFSPLAPEGQRDKGRIRLTLGGDI